MPAKVVALIHAALAGDFETARSLHLKYHRLFGNLFIDTNPIPIKAAMAMKGLIEETYRLPMCSMDLAKKNILRASLSAVGIL
jgi:4-hydroxy-tetrahydrodipicolinate synthase